jgi:hypothetical protein
MKNSKNPIIGIFAAILCGVILTNAVYADYAEPDPQPEVSSTTQLPIQLVPPSVTIPPPPAFTPPNTEITVDSPNNGGVMMFELPRGNATLIEEAFGVDTIRGVGRQFLTVQTRGGHTFYIVIETDMWNGVQNVYFLNAVDDWDLFVFAENFPPDFLEIMHEERLRNHSEYLQALANQGIQVNETVQPPTANGREITENANSDDESSGGELPDMSNRLIIVGVLIVGGVIAFVVIKRKKSSGFGGGSRSRMEADEDDFEEDDDSENE